METKAKPSTQPLTSHPAECVDGDCPDSRDVCAALDSSVARYADMLAAMGTEARLRVMRLLLAAHPTGMVVGEIQSELEIPNSTLSHHLERLKREGLVTVRRDRQYLWYSANAEALAELLGFLYAECCSRNKAIEPASIVEAGPPAK